MQISKRTQEAALTKIDKMFGRMIFFTVKSIPIDIHTLARRSWPKDLATSLQCCVDHMGESSINRRWSINLPVSAPSGRYSIKLDGRFPRSPLIPYSPTSPIMLEDLVISDDEFIRMSAWITNCERRSHIPELYATLEAVMKMVSTAGQIQRMIPDLLRFLPDEYAERAGAQRRRSSIPDAWYRVDREKINEAVTVLNTCYLLDPVPENNVREAHNSKYGTDELAYVTWAHKARDDSTTFNHRNSWTP